MNTVTSISVTTSVKLHGVSGPRPTCTTTYATLLEASEAVRLGRERLAAEGFVAKRVTGSLSVMVRRGTHGDDFAEFVTA